MTPRTVTNPLRAVGSPTVFLACAAGAALTATAAEDDSDAAEDEGGYIEEVVVTASKREVNLQDSSLAITAYTGEQLDSRGIREVTDIAAAIPGVDMAESVPTESILIIRSMSNNGRGYHRAEIWRQQTNTSYLDDVVLFPGITPLKMVDLERMEVRGGNLRVPIELPENRRRALLDGHWDSTGQLVANAARVREVYERLPCTRGYRSP